MSWYPAPDRYENMQYRHCGKSGLRLPALSLGLWHSFGHIQPLDAQRALLRKAFDLGITHFDLANNYGPPAGSAEENFGRLCQELCLFRQMRSGSAANFLFRIRQNPIPDSVPCIIFSGVRRIYPPGNPFFLEKAFYFCLSSFQKRTDNHAFPFRLSHRANPCHSVQTGAAEHVKQKRLRAVVPMMRHRNCTVTTAHLL